MKKQRIAFDFDKVFVNYPPFIPSILIDRLYKKKNSHLSYRIPGRLEQMVRIASHYPLLRPAIKPNLDPILKGELSKKADLFIISSRFSFLEKRTQDWSNRHNLISHFKKMHFNFNDEQPHLFKEKILREEKIDKFIDDDLDLLTYLAPRNPKVKFFWIFPSEINKVLPKGVFHVKNVYEFINKYV